jgi:hypothetical protein
VQFLFGDQVLDTDRRELYRGSAPIAVEPQVFDLLIFLMQHRDRVVSKDDLIAAIWDGRIVSESTLTSRINASEPGLLLTPPDKASETDDGYLSASEIAGLKLDADWVILSACNPAAGEAKGAEALSGLARAFFYAGDRSLLVSHWEVDSESTRLRNALPEVLYSGVGGSSRPWYTAR